MATHRAATAKWKRLRKQVIEEAKANELIHCPSCRTWLDYDNAQRPNSAEVDHIIPVAQGGKDELENCQVLCKLCNQTKGGGVKAKRKPAPRIETETRIEW